MKKLILIAAIGITVSCANAQKMKSSEVPAAVTAKFASLYPNIKDVDWEKEDANYEAGFELNKMEATVVIDANGNLLETEMEMDVTALSKSATDYAAKNYPAYKVKGAAKITDGKGTVMYEAELKNGKDEMDLVFDANGNFIKKVVEESKPEDEDDEKKK